MQLAKARMLLPKQGTYNKPRAGLHQFQPIGANMAAVARGSTLLTL